MIRVIDERALVAGLLAGDASILPPLVDDRLRAIAIATRALGAWRALITTTVEDLVFHLGGDAGDVEQLRREGALQRSA
jgi:hypothetical protein